MPISVSCPHCRTAVHSDPELAGQIVSCPGCHGQFQMPGTVPPPAARAIPASSPLTTADSSGFPGINTGPSRSSSSSAYRQRKKDSAFPMWLRFVLAGGAVLIICCGGLSSLIQSGGGRNGGGGGGGFSQPSRSSLSKTDFQNLLGMDRQQVINEIGRPDDATQPNYTDEEWLYVDVYDPITQQDSARAAVMLRGGIVYDVQFF